MRVAMREFAPGFCQPQYHRNGQEALKPTQHVSSHTVAQSMEDGVETAGIVDGLLIPNDILNVPPAGFLVRCILDSLLALVALRRWEDKDQGKYWAGEEMWPVQ